MKRSPSRRLLLLVASLCAAPLTISWAGAPAVSAAALASVAHGDAVAITTAAATAASPAPDFTLVALPDTQLYSGYYPATFTAQTSWAVSTRAALNTVFVTHLGDIVNTTSNAFEWQNAKTSIGVLDAAGIPYGLVRGNHDGPADFDAAFPLGKYTGKSWFGGSMPGKGFRDSYELFDVGSLQFVILHLEYVPPSDVIAWANGVLEANAGRRAIVSTHDYLLPGGIYSPAGTTLWASLVRPNCNVFLVLNGHASGEAARRDLNSCGKPVEQIVTDYQSRPNGGDGWLRYYVFHPATNSVDAHTYSPTLGIAETDADSAFSFPYDMSVSAPPVPSPPPVRFVTGSALGNALAGPFTITTKIQKLGGYITWRLDGGPGAANQTVSIWIARRTTLYGAWSAWYRLTTRRADANGVAYASVRTGSVQWISLRPVLGTAWGPTSIGRWIA